MTIRVGKHFSGLILLSAGLLAACTAQTNDPSMNPMDAFEAHKVAKGDDGSVATTLGDPAPAQVVTEQQDKPVINDWMLSVEPVKSEFVIGEPVVIRVKLQNVSDEAREAAPLLQPEYGQTRYTITRLETGGSAPYLPAVRYLALPATFMKTFQPGEFVEEEVQLVASKAGWMFKWPGKYEIQADFDDSTSGANLMGTHATIITIRDGNADERAAADLMMNGEAPLLVYWEQGDHATDGIAALETIAARYPATIHALYANFALGSNDAQPFFNGKFTRPPRARSAAARLEKVREVLASPNAPVVPAGLRTRTYTRLAEAYQQLGQPDQARAVLDEYLTLYASDPVMASGLSKVRDMMASL